MELIHTVRVTDAIMTYALVIMAIFTIIMFLALLYCASLLKKGVEGVRVYLKFASMQQAIMNKNIINLFPGNEDEKQKAKKELDVITANILNDLEAF